MILPIWTPRLFSRDTPGGILITFVRKHLETSGWLELLSKKEVMGGVFEVFLMI